MVLRVAIGGMCLSHLIVHGLELLHARRNLFLHRNGFSALLGQTSSLGAQLQARAAQLWGPAEASA